MLTKASPCAERNTSLPFFTSHERNALKSSWGTQSTRLTRDYFLPLGSCRLCLLPATDPVACPAGDVFCRECAVANLLAQRNAIKRAATDAERRKAADEERRKFEDERVRQETIREFEATQMGLDVTPRDMRNEQSAKDRVKETDLGAQSAPPPSPRGSKRKFELDVAELQRVARADRTKAQRALDDADKAAKPHVPFFWVPSQTPSAPETSGTAAAKHAQVNGTLLSPKSTPICPASSGEHSHTLSLKGLTAIHFHTEHERLHQDSSGEDKANARRESNGSNLVCPSCRKALSNSTKAVLAIPCGHVLCKPCVDQFLRPSARAANDAHSPGQGRLQCYVCEADLTGDKANAHGSGEPPDEPKKKTKGKKTKEKENGPKPGLVELRSEGTGYAGGGKSLAQKEGVVFQV